MKEYTHQVILRIGDTDPILLKGAHSFETKWAKINKKPLENHTVVSVFNDDLPPLPKPIDNQETRLTVLGHGTPKNNELITGDHKIKKERFTPNELAKKLSQSIDKTKIGTLSAPLKINLVMCGGGYSQKNKKSFAENLIRALRDNHEIHAEVTARESIVVSLYTGRKKTLSNTALEACVNGTRAAAHEALSAKNLELSSKSRFYATQKDNGTYTVNASPIPSKTKSTSITDDELFLMLKGALKWYNTQANGYNIKTGIYRFFTTYQSKDSLEMYSALAKIAETTPQNRETLFNCLNSHALKQNCTLRQILFSMDLINKEGKPNFERINPALSPYKHTLPI